MADVEKIAKIGKDMGLETEALRVWVETQLKDQDKRRASDLEHAKLQKENFLLKNDSIQRELELHRLRVESPINTENLNDSVGSASSTNQRAKVKLPSLPIFDDTKDKIEHWLTRFERYFDANRFEEDMKAVVLSAYLKGTALEVYNSIAPKQAFLTKPPSVRNSQQMSKNDTDANSKIANVRIYVEQAINRLKWYRMLSCEMEMTSVKSCDDMS